MSSRSRITVYKSGSISDLSRAIRDSRLDHSVSLEGSVLLEESILFSASNGLVLSGRAGRDVLRGGAGNDQLFGWEGSDRLLGRSGRDVLDGGRGHDTLDGGRGDDRLAGGAGRDVLSGAQGNDRLLGGADGDRLMGGQGRDLLQGGGGNDTITGGEGADRMSGGAGRDTFVFSASTHVSVGQGRDIISDFSSGYDVLDLRFLDADLGTVGVDAFQSLLSGSEQFTAPRQLRYDPNTGILAGNIDADPDADFEILLSNKPAGLRLGIDIVPAGPQQPKPEEPKPPTPTPEEPKPEPPKPEEPIPVSSYDKVALSDHPVLFLPMSQAGQSAQEVDAANPGRGGSYHNTVLAASMPNGDRAAIFDGQQSYLEVPDAPDLSATKTGILTIEAWLRPDALAFPRQEGSGYVHWMGKGELPGEMEWSARMYGENNTDVPSRENRISGYAFNPEGGRGLGSYFQDEIKPGDWIHYVFVINTTPNDPNDPGYTRIYRDGSNGRLPSGEPVPHPWDDMDPLWERWPTPDVVRVIEPQDGDAPLRIGTRDFRSFFMGAVGKVAIYDYELTPEQIQRHYDAMWLL